MSFFGVSRTEDIVGVLTPAGFAPVHAVFRTSAALSPVAVAAATTAEQTFTIPGLAVGDSVVVTKPTAQAGLGLSGARVSAPNTLAINFVNPTAAAITPTAAELYEVAVIR